MVTGVVVMVIDVVGIVVGVVFVVVVVGSRLSEAANEGANGIVVITLKNTSMSSISCTRKNLAYG
jgi:hypothetical protein